MPHPTGVFGLGEVMTNTHRFDAAARTWDDNPHRNALTVAFTGRLQELAGGVAGVRGLEIGCGTGNVGLVLAPLMTSLAMVDSSAGMLEVLAEKIARLGIENICVVQGDILTAPMDGLAFDLAYTLMALHHVPDVPALLDRLAGCLRPGGRLCIGDLYPEDGSFHGDAHPDVHRGFDPAELGCVLADHGFDIESVEPMQIGRAHV